MFSFSDRYVCWFNLCCWLNDLNTGPTPYNSSSTLPKCPFNSLILAFSFARNASPVQLELVLRLMAFSCFFLRAENILDVWWLVASLESFASWGLLGVGVSDGRLIESADRLYIKVRFVEGLDEVDVVLEGGLGYNEPLVALGLRWVGEPAPGLLTFFILFD